MQEERSVCCQELHNIYQKAKKDLFSYYQLIWMFCDRTHNAKINRLHERALQIAYNDYISSFEDLLVKVIGIL